MDECLDACRRALTNISAVDEAKEIKKRHGRDDIKVNFPSEPSLGVGIEDEERVTISDRDVSIKPRINSLGYSLVGS